MRVLFQTNSLNYRGTSVAVTDYAKYNQIVLGNESIICYNATLPNEKDMGNEQEVIDRISKDIKVWGYQDFNRVVELAKPDLIYRITSGEDAGIERYPCRTVNHAVFQVKNPHISAYVSEWLSRKMSDYKTPWVPHIIELPDPNADYREYLNIPKDALVFGRYGGATTFDIPWVKKVIREVVQEDSNIYFIFLGTEPFISHPNVRFISATHSLQKKSNFINTCDAMLHARKRGESFGLSIAEFLSQNKPVLAWSGGVDLNHVELLKNTGTLYANDVELKQLIKEVKDINYNFNMIVNEFSAVKVIKKFESVFIKNE
jgi:hypothetical protein